MASSVVRIDQRTLATLRTWAETEHKTVGQIVGELVHRRAEEQFWAGARADYDRLRVHPERRRAYEAELALFEGSSLDGLADEEPYYSNDEEAEIVRAARSESR